MDGFTTEVHDSIRGNGNHAKTMSAIRKISEKGVNARINTVLHTTNLCEVPDMAKFFVDELGLGFRLLPFIMENGPGVYACKSTGVPYDKTKELLDNFFFPFIRERKEKKLLSIELRTALVPIDIENHYICQWGTSLMGISPSGIASLCHVCNDDPNFIFGDLKTQSLTEIWEKNELLDSFRNFDPDQLRGVCGNCLAREICRGGCRFHAMIKYGNLYAPEPQCQTVYELGQFPEYALEDPEADNRYTPT
jgi:radical SAM protein with 4Fe4S-binding SPASM domain